MKFKTGDMIIPIGSDALNDEVYIIKGTGKYKNTPSRDGFLTYKVKRLNATIGKNRIYHKGCRFVHKNYRLATIQEKILYGENK